MNAVIEKTAIISDDLKYRYVLTRVFDEKLPMIAFVGLNPSTADAEDDDPTINKCIRYCKSWGYGGFYMVNLFAFRSPYPETLFIENDPIGPKNDNHLIEVFSKVSKVICCWGNTGTYRGRNVDVLKNINDPYCLSINGSGEPTHPLFIKSDLKPIFYNADTISISATKGKLKKQFHEQLTEIAKELSINMKKHDLFPKSWKNHSICFSYEDNGILYGIKRIQRDKNKTRLVEIEKTFKEEFLVSEWWPIYRHFYTNINSEPDFWADIKTGKAKERAKAFIETILNTFDTAQY